MTLSLTEVGMSLVLSVRVSRAERALLEAAAAQGRTSLGEFVRRRAVEAAEMEVLERRVVSIPAEAWEDFEAWAGAPSRDVPALRALGRLRPAWED